MNLVLRLACLFLILPALADDEVTRWLGGMRGVVYRAQAPGPGGQPVMQECLSVLPIGWFFAERDHHHPEQVIPGRGVR
jgi:hypothetical protein